MTAVLPLLLGCSVGGLIWKAVGLLCRISCGCLMQRLRCGLKCPPWMAALQ